MMKAIYDFFSHIDKSKIDDAFVNAGISLEDGIQFSCKNIVIGPNGAGKTRFIRTIRNLYETNNDMCVLYGYFPDLDANRKVSTVDLLPEYSLDERLSKESLSFVDFLKAIEADCEQFLINLFVHKSQNEKRQHEKAWDRIRDSFKNLCNKDLRYNRRQIFVIRSDGKEEKLREALAAFSPGELVIFYMSIFMLLQENVTKKKVVILDEPECHLHPRVLLKFVKMLLNQENVDVWIATHSLFLVPDVQFENIVYIHDSIVAKRRGKLYGEIIEGVLGEHRNNVSMSFSSIAQWQCAEFLAECFLNPEIVTTINPMDEQVQLFRRYLKYKPKRSILDFGAGSARLGYSLLAADPNMQEYLDYTVYDVNPTLASKQFMCYDSFDAICNRKFDCVVMMNVLHEIEPDEWPGIFRNIVRCMNDDADLIFVEAAILRNGELPNNVGYLVLSEDEIVKLFGYENEKRPKTIRMFKDQKSTCIIIPRNMLLKVNEDTVCQAIEELEKNAWEKVIECRKVAKHSRNYAFWMQLYVNAKQYNQQVRERRNLEYAFGVRVSEGKRSIRDNLYDLNYNMQVVMSDAYKALINYIGLKEEGRRKNDKEVLDAEEKFWRGIIDLRISGCDKKIIDKLKAVYSIVYTD